MKKYTFNIKDFKFILELSNMKPLWENEGVSQLVKLTVFNSDMSNVVLSTNLGVDYVLETFNKQRVNDIRFDKDNNPDYFYFGREIFYFMIDKFEDYCILDGLECIDFYDWFVQSLSIIEGRKMKIHKIKQKTLKYNY